MQKEVKSVGLTQTKFFNISDKILLESNVEFGPIHVAYETYGTLNEKADNAILLLHALTGDAHAAGYHDEKLLTLTNILLSLQTCSAAVPVRQGLAP